MTAITDLAQARAIAYSLSEPSKMPGYGYSIPAQTCKLGSLLAEVKNSVCSSCYAKKGRYVFQKVRAAMEARYQSLTNSLWVDAMAFLINHSASPKRRHPARYFRWHDSGDLQGIWHLEKIIEVCKKTPTVHHWLPTREIKMVREYLSNGGTIPSNLVIRLSSPMVGQKITSSMGLPISTVGYSGPDVFQCGAYKRGGECGPCRACWKNKDVNYPLH